MDSKRHILAPTVQDIVRGIRTEKLRLETPVYGKLAKPLPMREVQVVMQSSAMTGQGTPGAPAPQKGMVPVGPPSMHPEVNIKELTDQVIRQIEQKVIAHRERMGNVF